MEQKSKLYHKWNYPVHLLSLPWHSSNDRETDSAHFVAVTKNGGQNENLQTEYHYKWGSVETNMRQIYYIGKYVYIMTIHLSCRDLGIYF